MAASVTLNVEINRAQATADLQSIDSLAKSVSSKPIVINVQLSGADKAAAELAKLEAAHERTQQTANRLATQQARSADTVTNVTNANARLATAENRVAVEQEKTAQTANRLAIEQEKTARATMNAERAAQKGASGWSVLGGAISTALGHLASRALMAGINKIRQGVRDALTEMKNVDTELTNISKVSGKTGEELAAIGERAYETASRYGESASTYLEAVYSMQKAGMGDTSENMGELAIKTMLVGDTTQDVATKFLLAANAAWKLEGNMDRLTQIVDEADYINNNYATSLDKLAAGMPIVASIAAQTGMTAEETMAAIGTITAATQESGTKAATALRALILNISGEVGKYLTEEGEEFEVTAESVKSMQGLLEKYAKTEMDAARAAGEMIDPMTAIQAIFKGMAEDDLSDVELFNLLSGMGGKLRTNQLTALVQNFETLYKDMMDGMKGAAGTADKEIDLMMNSWERKSQVLKNTWTEFIADIVDTNTIKGGLDFLTGFVDKLDRFVEKASNPFFDSESTQKDIDDTTQQIQTLEKTITNLQNTGGSDLELKSLQNQLDILKQINELKKEQIDRDREEDARKLQNQLTSNGNDEHALSLLQKSLSDVEFTGDTSQLKTDLTEITSQYGQYYENLVKVRDAGQALTDSQQQFLTTYEGVRAAAESSVLYTGESVDGWYEVLDAQGRVVGQVKDIATAEREAAEERDDLAQRQQENLDAATEKFNGFIETITTPFVDAANALTAYYESLYAGISDAEGEAESLTSGVEDSGAAAESLTSGVEATGEAAGQAASATAGIGSGISSGIGPAQTLLGVIQAISAAAAGISIGVGGFGFATGTTNAPGGPTLVNELGPELISENGRAYIANGGRPGIVNLSRGAIVLPASVTEQALHSKSKGKTINAAAGETGFRIASGSTVTGQTHIASHSRKIGTGSVVVTVSPLGEASGSGSSSSGNTGSRSGKGGSGGGSSKKSAKETAEKLADETKDILSNLEKQAKLADNRKQYEKEALLYQKAQAQIDKQVAAYKKAGYKETDDEILDLLNKRFDYDKKIDTANKKTIKEAADELKDKLSNLDKQAKLADTEGDYLKEVQFYESAQEAIKEMVERYRKAGYKDDSTEIVELLQKNYDYADKQVSVYKDRWNELIDALETDTEQQELANKLAEKEQALLDAQEALSNAMGQRTIRTYNASTGQWEWVADQSKIKSAQESLTKAEESYAEEVKDQAIQELEQLRDTMADLNDVILGPALSAIMMKAESSDEFQNFARALNAVYGVGSYLSSTEGSSNVISTANDSHDTIYSFGNVTLTEEQASNMSVAQLAQKLQVLKIS